MCLLRPGVMRRKQPLQRPCEREHDDHQRPPKESSDVMAAKGAAKPVGESRRYAAGWPARSPFVRWVDSGIGVQDAQAYEVRGEGVRADAPRIDGCPGVSSGPCKTPADSKASPATNR